MTHDMTRKGLVHTLPGAADLTPVRGVYPTDHGPLDFDLYCPPHGSSPCPAVLFVTGFPDPAFTAMVGKPLKDWASYVDWARLVAVSGFAGITYLNRDPADVVALVRHLRANAGPLGIDAGRIAVWACSGNAPNALALVARERFASAVLLYPYTLDLDGDTSVADAAARFRMAVPPVSLDQLPNEMPLLVVRAGRDETPRLNHSLDRFVAAAQARRLPVTRIDHPDAPHSFDLVHDTPRSHEVIDEVLGFLHGSLGQPPPARG